jgi:hypothetical protein
MTASTLARHSTLVLSLLSLSTTLAAGCAGTRPPRATQAGDWHYEGSSSGLWSKTEGGDFGDTETIAVQVTGGRFATDQLLIEGIVGASDSNVEDDAGFETDISTMQLGIGARYYTTHEGSNRPYLGVRGGFSNVNVDDDFAGTDESDTSPFVDARLGMEAFVAESAAVDFGVNWQEIFSRDLGSVEEDLTTFGIYVGFSIWL